MYETFRDVVLAVREKYENATALARTDTGCAYAHDTNGIGCAIGCLYPAEVAKEMDAYGSIDFWDANTFDKFAKGMFGEKIARNQLASLQLTHDSSYSPEQFRFILDHWLNKGEWIDPWTANKLMAEGVTYA